MAERTIILIPLNRGSNQREIGMEKFIKENAGFCSIVWFIISYIVFYFDKTLGVFFMLVFTNNMLVEIWKELKKYEK